LHHNNKLESLEKILSIRGRKRVNNPDTYETKTITTHTAVWHRCYITQTIEPPF